jgi:hypothetical protein
LRNEERQEQWRPMSFGLVELADALPADVDLVGVVFMEESDDWVWSEPVSEIVAIRPEVYEMLEPHLRKVLDAGDHAALARLAEDHSESCVEFSPEQWDVLMRHTQERVPELLSVYAARLSNPGDYTSILEALANVADPRYQPSLDAWLRVHARAAQYALYFRDAKLERREFEGSGLIRLDALSRTGQTQPQTIVPDVRAQPPVMRKPIEQVHAPSEVQTDPRLPRVDAQALAEATEGAEVETPPAQPIDEPAEEASAAASGSKRKARSKRRTQKTVPMSTEDVKRAIERGNKD